MTRVRVAGAMYLMVIGAAASPLAAQVPEHAVRVQVVDAAGRGIANADLTVLGPASVKVTSGTTDSAGVRTLVVPAAGSYQVAARRFGYVRAYQFFTVEGARTAVRVQMLTAVQTLEGVIVTTEASVQRRAYHVDADDIAASDRPLVDAIDVLSKLRPEMVDTRTATSSIGGRVQNQCNLQDVWVNGQRVVYAPDVQRLIAEKSGRIRAQGAMHPMSAGQSVSPQPLRGLASVPLNVLNTLSSIHPEHIEEISRTDCMNVSVEGTHVRNAVFVVLKRGIAFSPGIGSYVDAAASPVAGSRQRIIGVFDEATGDALPDVAISDSASQLTVTTSATGTASLAFLPDGSWQLLLRKTGFVDQSVIVKMSPDDTLPITLLMSRTKAP